MCIAVPMKIVSVDSLRGRARAVYRGNELEIDIRLVKAEPESFVLVHAGCAIETVREEVALEADALLRELEELANGQ